MDLKALQHALGGQISHGQLLCPGPGHSRVDRSLAVKIDANAPDGFLVHSFAGDDAIECRDYVRAKCRLQISSRTAGTATAGSVRLTVPSNVRSWRRWRDKAKKTPNPSIASSPNMTTQNSAGTMLYQALRLEPKDFRQRGPDGKGGWLWKLDDIRRVPYRWPELLKYPDATVFITEGEKDAERVASLGQCATTVACGGWTDDCVKALAGRDCIILQDNDDAGTKKALAAAHALHGTAKTVRVVLLPNLPDKGDVSDWLDAGGTIEKLIEIVFDAPLWTPDTSPPQPSLPLTPDVADSGIEEIADADVTDTPADKSPPTKKPPLIRWLDMSNWDHEPRPEREWAIPDRVPLNQAGLFSGEGGAGKSIIEMMKDVAHVTGKDWFGSLPVIGPAIYLGAEDDEREIHIRFYDIARHYGVTFKEMIAGGLHVVCKLGEDATLCASSAKSGKVETTCLYRELYEAAGDIKPKNISIDTLSRAFAGNEIDRVQVYGFANHMQALAMVAGGSVTVLSHPSLHGISSGAAFQDQPRGMGPFASGNISPHLSRRTANSRTTTCASSSLRKTNMAQEARQSYCAISAAYSCRRMLMGSLDKVAAEQAADNLFLDLLDQHQSQGRNVSHLKNANAYAPTQFSKDPKARAPGMHKALTDAMERLFAAKKIKVENYGKRSNPHYRIVRYDKKEE